MGLTSINGFTYLNISKCIGKYRLTDYQFGILFNIDNKFLTQ